MKILALDFSSPQRSVAVGTGNEMCEAVETGGRGTKAFALIENALHGARLEREQIECIAVGLGPGSYTGVRAAIALAQGWQLAHTVKLIGMSSVRAIVAGARSNGIRGNAVVVIDAQRNEFYVAGYGMETCEELSPLRLVARDDVLALERDGNTLVGPEVTKWFPAGRIVFPRAAKLIEAAAHPTEFVSREKLEPIYLRETSFVKAPPPRQID
jgi:tRNA threonylcarbamoyl adenosine modification protein YeaZ